MHFPAFLSLMASPFFAGERPMQKAMTYIDVTWQIWI
jgi:hypothetical protein